LSKMAIIIESAISVSLKIHAIRHSGLWPLHGTLSHNISRYSRLIGEL
jgi:hypothetical protein